MATVRSYSHPPPVVHASMRALFLLLGHPLSETKEWKRCQALSNSIALNKKVNSFDIRNVAMETSKQAKNILDGIRVEDVQVASEGAATFYVWVSIS